MDIVAQDAPQGGSWWIGVTTYEDMAARVQRELPRMHASGSSMTWAVTDEQRARALAKLHRRNRGFSAS